ncbi:hypothetical protein EMIHUDRAFT_219407 [Emiliania huxleyi CCMP1516]|uniref:Uncharacterized protein n=2 Tax=Emiliania huxleyi TaxID=2903 RepID=A0A0D3I4B8_EMIH1|nr:hypothetical protein EMIHUDRAFT_219407 [Emiliania huxleyi CCMP1516]EOD06103.1 hypothetical protein EMIHUDRAFT_219407 [Emiliania huxleyi CCMP1516]|eukprot:XP_005758532.1 hypothetical protein EMIHUDRAFT_219407 [Emiliania huxleyi CCMP1516]
MLDPTWHAETGVQVTSACGDAFDVVLSDGAHILKVVLSTALNELVYSGRLEPRGVVTVRGWEARADERALSASAPDLIVVTQLAPRDGLTFAVAEPAAGAAPLARPHREPLPLAGRRRHYLKLRSDEALSSQAEIDAVARDGAERSSLSHWGGPHEKGAQSFATCFELTLADASGEMAVEATIARHTAAAPAAAGWGEPRLPTRRRPGAVLMVRDYALREVAGDEGGKRFVAKLNPAKHPKVPGRVDVLTEAQVQQLDSLLPGRLLPPRRPPLSDASGVRRKLAVVHAAQQYLGEAEELADVIGRVVASLPPFRFRRQPNGDRAFVRFVRARWLQVLVADSGGGGAAQLPLLLLEHHCGGPAGASGFFDGVAPGDDVLALLKRAGGEAAGAAGDAVRCDWRLQRPLVPIRDVARCLEELHGGEEAYVVLRASASLSPRGQHPPQAPPQALLGVARLESPLAAQPVPVAFALADADAKGRGGALWAAVASTTSLESA